MSDPLRWLSGFATWLPAHCGLVSDLDLDCTPLSTAGTVDIAAATVQLALRVCVDQAAQPLQPPTAAAAAAGDSGFLQDAAPLPMRLSRFSAGALTRPAVMRLLAALGVRELHMWLQPAQVTPALCSTLSHMHSVRRIRVGVAGGELPLRLAAAVGRLPQLTRLYVISAVGAGAMQALPASLEELRLARVCRGDIADFSHLTALSRLRIECATNARMQLILPAQPGLHVRVEGWADIRPGSGLCRLAVSAWELQDLRVLASLQIQPHLRTLSLRLSYDHYILINDYENSVLHAALAASLGQLTGLTQLVLRDIPPVLVQLPRLRQLLDLSWDCPCRVSLPDVLQLSTLTQLTGLTFYGDGLDDAAAVVLASALTRLQRLCLRSGSIVTWSMLAVIGRLTKLFELSLTPSGEAHLEPLMLQYFSTLTGLTWLQLPARYLFCSQDIEPQLLAMIPGLRELSHEPCPWPVVCPTS
jgi:hypothetical protein